MLCDCAKAQKAKECSLCETMNQRVMTHQIVRLSEDGMWNVVKECSSWEEADFEHDRLSDQFSHAVFEVWEKDDA